MPHPRKKTTATIEHEQLAALTLRLSGAALRWEEIDEDVTVRGIIEGRFQLALPTDRVAA